jgi:putative transposase
MVDLSQIAAQDWTHAQERAEVLRPLANLEHCPRHLICKAATKLKLSARQVYTLISRLHQAGGAITALLPNGSDGGRGKRRLSVSVEAKLHNLIEDIYLNSQKYSAANFVRAVRNQLRKDGIPCPSESTIRRRLQSLTLSERCRRDEAHPEATPI